jgi:hypothetical protein
MVISVPVVRLFVYTWAKELIGGPSGRVTALSRISRAKSSLWVLELYEGYCMVLFTAIDFERLRRSVPPYLILRLEAEDPSVQ